MEFRVLGPIEVIDEGRVVPLNAAKPRAVLAMLLLRANEFVPSDRLIDDLWDAAPPATAPKILQKYVSQLRKALGHEAIETGPAGYRLRLDPEPVELVPALVVGVPGQFGRGVDQFGHSVVVLGIFGRSATAKASSSVATITADGASARS